MKTLKPGSLAPKAKWICLKLKCAKCGGEFETEEGDVPLRQERSLTGCRWYLCPTPDCRNEIKVSHLEAVLNSDARRLENERGDKAFADVTRDFIRG